MDTKQTLLASAAILATSLAVAPDTMAQTNRSTANQQLVTPYDTIPGGAGNDFLLTPGADTPSPVAATIDGGARSVDPQELFDTVTAAADTLGGGDGLDEPMIGPDDTITPAADTIFATGDHDPAVRPGANTIHAGADTFPSAADTVSAGEDTIPGAADYDLIVDEFMGTLSGELLVEQNRLPAIQVPPPVEIPRTVVPTTPAGETPAQPNAVPGAQGKPKN